MSMQPLSEFPDLQTERMNLRAVHPGDVQAFHALMSIPEVTRLSNWPDTPGLGQCADFISRMADAFPSGNGCSWAMEDRESGRLIGAVRFNYFIRDWFCGGVGYEIHPDYWGKGWMTEALRSVIACGDGQFGLNRIEAWTLRENVASARVLEKCGFRFEGTLRQRAHFKGRFHDLRWFGRVIGDSPSADRMDA